MPNALLHPAATALALGLCLAGEASAVLIEMGDGAGNDTAPFWTMDPGFANVGTRGALSVVYLGGGFVLTANHVGVGDVVFDGAVHRVVPDTAFQIANPDGVAADLVLFQVHPRPDLPDLPIAAQTPELGSPLVVVGHGRDRGASLEWDPNGSSPPGVTQGYSWKSTHTKRWGTNFLETNPSMRVFGTEAFGSRFDADGMVSECQATTGDSGGAAFARNPATEGFELAGVVIAVSVYAEQPSATTFHGQTTYYADLAPYREEILERVALPEPAGSLGPALALLALLRLLRRPR